MGCHNLPKGVGCRIRIPGELRFCNLCQIGQPGDEYHLIFEIQALQGVRDKCPYLLGEHAALW